MPGVRERIANTIALGLEMVDTSCIGVDSPTLATRRTTTTETGLALAASCGVELEPMLSLVKRLPEHSMSPSSALVPSYPASYDEYHYGYD